MGSGLVGMWEVNSWMGYAWPAWSEKFAWDVAAVPAGPNGVVLDLVDADTAVIPAASKNPDEAWEVMKWFFEPEQYKVLIDNYSCLPADTEIMSTWKSDQEAKYPGVDFQVFFDALNYLEKYNHESWKPDYSKVNTELTKAHDFIMTGENLDVQAVAKDANTAVQAIIDAYWAANPQP